MSYQQPDPRLRKRALYIISAAFIALLLLTLFASQTDLHHILHQKIDEFLTSDPIKILHVLCIVLLPMVLISVVLFRTGRLIIAQQRFPYDGQMVIRRTRILKGKAAVKRGRLIQILAVFLCLAAVSAFGLIGYLILTLNHAF